MPGSIDASLVRIRTVDGEVVGAGFLAGECQVLTCAHVIAQALSLPDTSPDPPRTPVVLDFPLLAPHTRLAAKVILWCPVNDDGSGDIAGLELLGDPPEGAKMVHFAPAEDVWEHPFRAFGFPTGQDDGVWATGRLLGRQATNWLLLEDVKTEGFPVIQGFSGGPVWDTQLQGVVGMIVASSRRTETKIAFVLPFDVLSAAWPSLQPITYQRIFLSATPADKTFAERLRADLQAEGIVVWDEQRGPVDTSTDVEERVRRAIRAAQAVLLVVSSQARTSRTVKEHLHLANLYHRRLVLVQISNGGHSQPPIIWQDTVRVNAHNTAYETALEQIEAALSQSRSRTGLLEFSLGEPAQAPRNPYKGLHPFTANDVEDFFGRERLVNDLLHDVATLLEAEPPDRERGRCLTIIGPSGSGKSSVVMAGLLPRLQHGALPESDTWVYLEPMLPGKHPLEALMLTLKPHFPDTSFKTLREDLEDDATQGLHLLAKQLVKEREGRVVLLVDQFEELFTQTESEDERRRFIDLLLTAATAPDGPLLLLLTLRADFYDRPMQYPSLSHLIQAHQRPVLPMDAEDLRATIEQPAALPDVQLTFEGNLVGDLLFEMQGQVGALPLLQFTLDQLFERRDGQRLALQAYHEIGGVKGALSQHAERTYAALPSEEHCRLAQALFRRLMEPGASEQDITRRRVALSELTFDDPTQTRLMRETIDAFIAARLLTAGKTTDTTTLEVSHEAVLWEWKRIADWLHEARGDILIQQDLSKDTAEWEQRNKPRDRLYRGAQLKEAQAWAKRNRPSGREVAFLRACAVRRTQSLVSLIAIVLLLTSSIGIAGWFLATQPPNPTIVTTLQDNISGSLRYCIEHAPSGSTIRFDSHLQGPIGLKGSLEFLNDEQLIIEGPGAGKITISGNSNTDAHIHVPPEAKVRISGLSFKNSQTTIYPFLFNEGDLTLSNSVISDNRTIAGLTSFGGGIFNSGTLTVIKSTISNNSSIGGDGEGQGGGIDNDGHLIVVNSTFLQNTASSSNGAAGGGICNTKIATAKVEGSTFLNNKAVSNNDTSFGGGIYNFQGGKVVVTNSIFSGNSSSSNRDAQGGAIDNDGQLTVLNSTILKNTALSSNGTGYGGAISNSGTSIAIVEGSTFSDNSASGSHNSRGGGIDNDGKLTVVNSTFLRNRVLGSNDSTGYGGGIANANGTVIIRFCTLYKNTSDAGGGIWTENSQVTMSDSIITENSAQASSDIAGALISEGYNLLTNITGINGLNSTDKQVTSDDLKIDPTLGNNGGPTQTLKLLPGSAAIDAIPLQACRITITDAVSGQVMTIITDQRGDPRPDGPENTCDIGAYESSY